jgi:hypothetical protein
MFEVLKQFDTLNKDQRVTVLAKISKLVSDLQKSMADSFNSLRHKQQVNVLVL